MIFAGGNVVEHLRLQDIGARIDGVDRYFVFIRFFQKPSDAAILLSLDQSVSARVFDGREHDRRHGLAVVVLADNCFQIQVRQNIAVEDYRRFANQVFRKLISTGSTHGLGLDGVAQLDAVVRSIAEQLLDLVGLVGKRKRDVGDAGATQSVDLIKEKRSGCK